MPLWRSFWGVIRKSGANLRVRRFSWAVAFFAAVVIIMGLGYLGDSARLEEGQPSPRDFKAPRTLVYASEVLTEKARVEAVAAVKPVYMVSDEVTRKLANRVKNYFRVLEQARATDKDVAAALGLKLPADTVKALQAADAPSLASLEQTAQDILTEVMGRGVQEDALEAARQRMLEQVGTSQVPSSYRPFLTAIFRELELESNFVYDAQSTARLREQARAEVTPVQVTVRKNEKIVGEGEIVKPEHLEVLRNLGLLGQASPLIRLVGLALLVAVLFVVLGFYLWQFHRHILENEPEQVLLGLLLLMTVALSRLVIAMQVSQQPEMAGLVGYMAPVAAGSMLIAILLDVRLSVFVTAVMALLVGTMMDGQLAYAVVALVGGLAGIYSISHLHERLNLVQASLYLMAVNVVTIVALGLLQHQAAMTVAVGVLMGIGNGVFSTVLTIGTLPFWETVFGITTPLKLLELANPSQPLLKRMLVEAPGTYHHSLLVANLAEAAAEALGADTLLARVGAYYHDIGKIKRPYFFIENQLARENPHDKLAPTLSTLIITSHVKDGLEIGREAGLPPVLLDIVAQHHGSSLLLYFYQKASESEQNACLSEKDFRYDCRKPQTKEAALVMLADGVEAGVRSMQNPTPGRMEGFVRRLIREKLEDGQLDECNITLRELDAIAQSFVRSLSGIFHSRIEYPESVVKEMERRAARGATVRKQSAG
ncbi:MAG: HDIG domain-containing protein [Clostridia bacterium]|nr:MAG: HDIG domain-containing protein [Clostridia bacterium]